jgi:hypothetical protein
MQTLSAILGRTELSAAVVVVVALPRDNHERGRDSTQHNTTQHNTTQQPIDHNYVKVGNYRARFSIQFNLGSLLVYRLKDTFRHR